MARVQKPKAQSKPGLGRPELAWSMSTYQFNWCLMSGPMNSWSGFMSMNGFKHLTSNSVSDSWVTTEQARFPVPSGGENGEEHSESQLQIPWKTETDKIRFPPPAFCASSVRSTDKFQAWRMQNMGGGSFILSLALVRWLKMCRII